MAKAKSASNSSERVGGVEPREITEELRASYLDYAMSVIVARALPDVRDGLKPVHRRILVTTKDLNLTPGAKHRKSAKIAGDVSGNYHPHGESNVYPAMARLAQDFALRYPLIDGQGNFGSIDGDEPAAMRYTEARQTAMAELLLADIDKATVDFIPNYDNTRTEPVVLPAAIPQLILNGTLGIAVGMASNIPPHNLGEVVDGVVALVDNPELTIDELLAKIPGPDFPTGGLLFGGDGLRAAYSTGRGRVDIRGVAEIEERQGRHRIIISEIPYQVNKADLVRRLADLVRAKKLEGIADLRDESDRQGLRIVVELKKNAYPKKILNRLYSATPLQTAFHFNMVALVDGIEPRTLGLRELLQHFIDHRERIITRRSEFDRAAAAARAHTIEGLLTALDNIDRVVEIIRASKTRAQAHDGLKKEFSLSDEQAGAILDMRLATLVGLERTRLQTELAEKKALVAELAAILADRGRLLTVLKQELLTIKERHSDPRRTRIQRQELNGFSAEDLIPNETVLLTLTKTGYVKRVTLTDYRSQGRGGKGVIGMTTKEQDEVLFTRVANTHDDILFFTDRGRLFRTKVFDVPTASRQAKGTAVVNVIQTAPDESVTTLITVPATVWSKRDQYLVMGTERGVIKKTAVQLYRHVCGSGIRALTLKNNDVLRWAHLSSGNDAVVEVSAGGQAIVYQEKDVRPMGRSAAGVRGMRLRATDSVISMLIVSADDRKVDLLVVTEHGFGKRTALKNFPLQKRGGVGIKAANVTKRTGPVVAARPVVSAEADLVLTSAKGQVIKLPVAAVKQLGRVTQGVMLMRLHDGDTVSAAAIFNRELKVNHDG